MQPGFASKKKSKAGKKKAKKKAEQKSKAAALNNDVQMGDASMSADASDDGIDYTYHGDDAKGKSSHMTKLQLKKSLKVRVAALKNNRAKLTKLPAHKQQRKVITDNIKEAMETITELENKKKATEGSTGAAAAPATKGSAAIRAGKVRVGKKNKKGAAGKKSSGGQAGAAAGSGDAMMD